MMTNDLKMAVKTPTTHDDSGLRLAAARDLKDLKLNRIPDVRGWTVEFRDGVVAGKVTRIIVDQKADFVPRYLEVSIERVLFGSVKPISNDLLVPIGRAQVAKDRDVVLLPFVTKEMLAKLPMLSPGAIDATHELKLAKMYGLDVPMANVDALYRHDWFSIKDFMVLRPTVIK